MFKKVICFALIALFSLMIVFSFIAIFPNAYYFKIYSIFELDVILKNDYYLSQVTSSIGGIALSVITILICSCFIAICIYKLVANDKFKEKIAQLKINKKNRKKKKLQKQLNELEKGE